MPCSITGSSGVPGGLHYRDVEDKRMIDLIKSAIVTPVIATRIEDDKPKKKIKRKYHKKRALAEDEPKPDPYCGPDKTRKMDYIRYGGHILIGVRGPRADAATLRKQMIEFCDQRRVVYPTLSTLPLEARLSVRREWVHSCRLFHTNQAHSNAQMNKFLLTMVEWYRFADIRKKVVNFCSYIIRGSLAKLYAAKYKLRSRAKVYKIGSRNLSRPLKERKGQSPEYHNLLRMGLVESIDALQYTRMSLVPETDYSPFRSNWRPDHEKALMEYISLNYPKTFEEQQRCIHEQGLVLP
ncbi:hypothetical protein SAY86_001260 [Trapa natans]|uniref:Domain X domain-containing protein n=1 Tax=Trapa natans TaxID=22666 RepID=A0AAN7RGB7_TRANT|nr:hypothetical protein SAY86_001260 [Trapa natans]